MSELSVRLTRTSSSRGPDYWTLSVMSRDWKVLVEARLEDAAFADLLSARVAYPTEAIIFHGNIEKTLR